MEFTDTDRLNFILSEVEIDDIGDEYTVPGVIVRSEDLEEKLTWGKEDKLGNKPSIVSFGDNLRDVIDRAMIAKIMEVK